MEIINLIGETLALILVSELAILGMILICGAIKIFFKD